MSLFENYCNYALLNDEIEFSRMLQSCVKTKRALNTSVICPREPSSIYV